jgi:hypothetical protein
MIDTASDLLSQLLEGAVSELDIPRDLRAAAEEEYKLVGNWLADHSDAGGEGWEVYPQGSFLLGTVVRPLDRDEYDLDIVCRRNIPKESTTQALLKAEVGGVLDTYVEARQDDPEGPNRCDEGKRCWTLCFPVNFHLDVLPAIPNEAGSRSAILLTDKKLRHWQHSDPRAFAEWFEGRMHQELVAKRLRLAEARRTPPEPIPDAEIKTTLQLVVQVLKHHRNLFFAGDLDTRPASILVTTLAAHAYRGERNLHDAVLETVELMPDYIERDGAAWHVPNPVEPRENFADKWSSDQTYANRFFEWLDQLQVDLVEAGQQRGLDKVASRLSESFGREPVRKAAGRLGDTFREEREAGRLRLGSKTGALSTAGAVPVRRHDFYGS